MLRRNPKMVQKHKLALFQQLVLKGVSLTSVIGGNTNIDRKLAKSNLVVIQTVSGQRV